MIKQKDINKLYETMASDMKITQFNGEEESKYRNRILYSGLGKWIMQLFADRDSEENDSDSVSKMHVTISALNIIDSFKKVSDEACRFFEHPKKTANEIEDVYFNLGYINSGTYTYKYPKHKLNVDMGGRSLIIDLDTNVTRFRGLGLYGGVTEKDIRLEEFFFIKEDALTYFKNLIKKLKFEPFDSTHGKIEVYNVKHNKWDFYNEKYLQSYDYSILKIDGGLDYKIVKLSSCDLYSASLPGIYSRPGDSDENFGREVWRVILGLCAYNNKPAIATIEKYCDTGIKITLGGYVFPLNEFSVFRCMTWPENSSIDINTFITDEEMLDAVLLLLKHLSIDILM